MGLVPFPSPHAGGFRRTAVAGVGWGTLALLWLLISPFWSQISAASNPAAVTREAWRRPPAHPPPPTPTAWALPDPLPLPRAATAASAASTPRPPRPLPPRSRCARTASPATSAATERGGGPVRTTTATALEG